MMKAWQKLIVKTKKAFKIAAIASSIKTVQSGKSKIVRKVWGQDFLLTRVYGISCANYDYRLFPVQNHYDVMLTSAR